MNSKLNSLAGNVLKPARPLLPPAARIVVQRPLRTPTGARSGLASLAPLSPKRLDLNAQREVDRLLEKLAPKAGGGIRPVQGENDAAAARPSGPASVPPAVPDCLRDSRPKEATAASPGIAVPNDGACVGESALGLAAAEGLRLSTRSGVVVALLAVAALSIAIIGELVHGVQAQRDEQNAARLHTAVEQTRGDLSTLKRYLAPRVRALEADVSEMRHPPTAFAEAQDAFSAGRWADAEAGYARYLVENPAGRMADEALYRATVASVLLGDCSLAGGYAARVGTLFPHSSFSGDARVAAARCVVGTHRASN